MNKKLIAAAVAAAFVAPTVASAEAVIYGSLHTSLQYTDQDSRDDDFWDTASNDGALGIKGSEDLGGGLKALYKVEFNIFPAGDTTPGSVGTQSFGDAATMDEIWVGLTGGFGTVLIGTEDTPYKTFMDSAGVDILGDSIVDVDTITNSVGADGFERFTAVGTVAYVSPNFSGFTFGAAIVPGGQWGNGPFPGGKNNNTDIAEHYSIAGNYKAGGLVIAAGYENKVALAEAPGVNEKENELLGIGASYTFGSFKIGAKYENDDNGDAYNSGNTPLYDEADRYAVSGLFTFGNNEIGAVYTYEDQDGGSFAADAEYTGWGLFGAHNFSNRTKVYAAYANADRDDDAPNADDEADKFAVGVIHSF